MATPPWIRSIRRLRAVTYQAQQMITQVLADHPPCANPRSVQELKAQLGLNVGAISPTMIRSAPAELRFPWGTVLILAGVIGILWLVFRRRNTYGQYPAAGPGVGGAPGPYGPGGYGSAPMGGGGIGSGIAGGLASGLAVGAGVVAGE